MRRRQPGRVGLIVAADPDGVIGHDGAIPWHYRADLQRFKRITTGGTLIVGRRTFETLPKRLPGRMVIVVTRATCLVDPFVPDALASSLWDALAKAEDLGKPVWIAGGGQLYADAMDSGCVDTIDLTLVPSTGLAGEPGVVRFRMEDLLNYRVVEYSTNPEDPSLQHRTYVSTYRAIREAQKPRDRVH